MNNTDRPINGDLLDDSFSELTDAGYSAEQSEASDDFFADVESEFAGLENYSSAAEADESDYPGPAEDYYEPDDSDAEPDAQLCETSASRLTVDRRLLAVIAAAACVIAIAAALIVFFSSNVIIGGRTVPIEVTELDLRGSNITELDGLERCRELKSLDVRDNPLEPAQIEWLSQQLPDCDITWSIVVGGVLVDSTSQQLDLRGRNLTSLDGLSLMTGLSSIDVRENPLDPEETAELIAALPNCQILWDVMINGDYYDSASTELDLSGTDITDLSAIPYLQQLTSLDLRQTPAAADDIIGLASQLPGCRVMWDIPIGGQVIDSTVGTLTLGDISADEVRKLQYFTDLVSVDATACKEYAALDEMADILPDCDISWNITIGGKVYNSVTSTYLKITGDISDEELALVPYLRGLTKVNAKAYKDIDKLYPIVAQMEGCKFDYEVILYGGKVYKSTRQRITLNNAVIEDYDRFKTLLGYLPELKYISLENSNLTNDQLDGLHKAYPYLTVHWMLKIGRFNIPSDCQVFSCLNFAADAYRLTSEDMDLLRYCTDMRLIDLGHNWLTNLDFMEPMAKLQAVIVTDNPNLTDISALAGKQDLVFLELMTTGVTDISALSGLPSLADLTTAGSPVADFSPLHSVTSLELFVPDINAPIDQLQALKEKVPGCIITGLDEGEYNLWLKGERYAIYKECFNCWDFVDYFNSTDDYKI